MLDLLIDVSSIELVEGLEPVTCDELLFMMIVKSFDNIWRTGEAISIEQITNMTEYHKSFEEILGISFLTSKVYQNALESPWYSTRRFVMIGRMISLLTEEFGTRSLTNKLVVVHILASLLDGLPTYLGDEEFDNYALFTAARNLNNHVVSNPTLQSYHQFDTFVSKVEKLFEKVPVNTNSEVFVKWCDEMGIAVSIIVIHALLLILSKHQHLQSMLVKDLRSSLKIII